MIIDAHMHYADDDPDFLALLAEYDLKFLNICFVKEINVDWRAQADLYCQMAAEHPRRFAWCTSFTLPDFVNPHWHDEAMAALDADFANGALACKVWKNVGMELRKPDGSFAMPDDPIFDPIYEHVAARGKTLLCHIAEPIACWQPLTGDNPHMAYYRDNPEWHMYNRPEYPSHTQLIAARDHLVAKHPRLRVVGAHLGSLEYDVDEVAARLDKYPNFAVDISARLIDLAIQPTDKVRTFFLRYADRVLYGTDVVMRQRPSTMAPEERSTALQRLRDGFETHLAYFNHDKQVSVRDRVTTGLKLPSDTLHQFYVKSAQEWYPGL
jgi:predicted TIM-barrel fold metal-dependent hydrolase